MSDAVEDYESQKIVARPPSSVPQGPQLGPPRIPPPEAQAPEAPTSTQAPVQPASMTRVGPHIGRIEAFDQSIEEWSTYVNRMKNFLDANEAPDHKKAKCFLVLVGARVYGILEALCFPEEPGDKEFDQLVDILDVHFEEKTLVLQERFAFWHRYQKDSESIQDYALQIRKLAKKCKFGDFWDQMLRDRLVCGVRSSSIQRRLLLEDEISFKEAIEIAVDMERKRREFKGLKADIVKVNRAGNPRVKCEPCHRCGKTGHRPSDCRFRNSYCYFCGERGHIQSVCRAKQC